MTGYSREELCGDQTDGYGRLVHPNDRGRYREALAGLSAGGTCTLEYRLCRKDGTILSVQDTISTACDRQGQWIATSVLADITPLREENQALRFLSDTVPCGFLRYTCQPQPSVTYLNQTMAELLRLPEQERAHWDRSIYRSNIFLLIPQEERETDALRLENETLRENVQALMDRFTDGGAAFVVTGRRVTPLYASDNVRGFFGFSPEQWEALRKKSTPMEEFVAHSHGPYARFAALLEDGEAEFSYEDFSAGCWRKIKAICSRRGEDPGAPRYVMLYRMSPGEDHGETEVSLRTFGYFDVFVGNQAVVFRSGKAKELLALMVDRRGGFISSGEAISFLWEDEPVSTVTLARYRKVALRLKNTLEEYGISEIVETVDGRRRIVPERVQCDLFDYLAGKRQEGHLFRGSYLTNYSWGEATLAELCGDLTLE